MLENYITRCHRRLGSVPVGVRASWGQDASMRANGRRRALGPQWPTVEQPQLRWGRSAAMVRRTWGQYVAVCPRFQLTSLTQPKSTFSRIKCERYIFIKKCVRSFIEVVIIVDYVSAYICLFMRLYNTRTLVGGGFLPLCRDAICVFYCPRRLGCSLHGGQEC